MKNLLKTLFIGVILFSFCASFYSHTGHAAIDYEKEFFKNVEDSNTLVGTFKSSEHAKTKSTGINILNAAMGKVTSFWKQIIGSIAILMIIVAGFRMATTSEEETINSQKQIILWCIIGLVLVLTIDVAVKEIFYGKGGEGSYIFEKEENIKAATTQGKRVIEALVNWLMPFIAAVSVVMIMHSGVRLILALGSEEVINKEKTLFYWVGFGLIMIAMSKVFINAIYVPGEQPTPGNYQTAVGEVVGLIQWGLVIIAVVAFAALVYGGFLYILNWANEEGVEQAKKIIFSSLIGIAIIITSYAIVATMISASSGY